MTEKVIYEGPIFTLVNEDVTIKNKVYQRDIIHHPGGVGILCMIDHKILLVKQVRQAIDLETIEIPAGKLEYGEDPLECGMRELNEETGYACSSMRLIQSFYTTPGFCDEKLWIYEAIDPIEAKEHLPQDEDEGLHSFWLPLEEAYSKVLNQEITDAKTIIAILYAVAARRE